MSSVPPAVPLLRALPPPRPCLASPAGDFLSRQGVAVSLVNQRLRHSALGSASSAPPPVELTQAQAVHRFLLQQQRLRRITSAALVLECIPEALLLDVQQQLRPLLVALKDMGLSQVRPWMPASGWGNSRPLSLPATGCRPSRLLRTFPCVPGRHATLHGSCPDANTDSSGWPGCSLLSWCRSRRRPCSAGCVAGGTRWRSSWRWARPSCSAATSGCAAAWGWRAARRQPTWQPSPACCWQNPQRQLLW